MATIVWYGTSRPLTPTATRPTAAIEIHFDGLTAMIMTAPPMPTTKMPSTMASMSGRLRFICAWVARPATANPTSPNSPKITVTPPRSAAPMWYTSLKYKDNRARKLAVPAPKKAAAHHVRRSDRIDLIWRKPPRIDIRDASWMTPTDSPRAGSRNRDIRATHTKVGRASSTNATRQPATADNTPATGPPNRPTPVEPSKYNVKMPAI